MTNRPEQRPEGKLIAAAQERSKLSQREAASRAGISEATWRNVAKGYKTVAKGVYVEVEGSATVVARMAQVVDVTPEQLEEADRADAAAELRELPPLPEPQPERTLAEVTQMLEERIRWFEEDNERRRREDEERIRRLEEEVRRLGGQSG